MPRTGQALTPITGMRVHLDSPSIPLADFHSGYFTQE